MTKLKKHTIKVVSLLGAAVFLFSSCTDSANKKGDPVLSSGSSSYAQKLNGSLKTNQEAFYDSDVIYKLPTAVSMNDTISVIVTMNTDSIVDSYLDSDGNKTISDYVGTKEAKLLAQDINRDREKLIKKLNASGVNYQLGEKYDTVLSGFEITLKAKDFETVGELLKEDASLIVGEVYEPAITEIVTNEVDVYDTGIFTGLEEFKGDGVVVAVLDTGLDYTHSAFDPANFPEMGKDEDHPLAFELSDIKNKISSTSASDSTSGLLGEDVYLNKKVPYAYDYADKDPDVLPINSEHGTHVAGIIAGKDDTITGVAPNAQLAIMKVFSDTQTGARTSWILAALEDCVTLGVDVINMSLGSACGFAREEDGDRLNDVYDSVREAGISLIASAANEYNATMNSEKNGNLGLTSNPDSGTVGSPSTYAAALSVASVDGVKTPYLKYGEEIIYFNEASTSDGKQRDFVNDLLNKYEEQTGIKTDTHEFEYVTIPGIGRESDYMTDVDYTGKIVLVKRGTSTFEEKVRVALNVMNATGIIIYNNVSGSISMAVGDNVGPVCSIAQDEGELLAAYDTGKVTVSRNNTAGPFMSDFSSWGPTSDLQIKPEITAHGGEILSAVPGGEYERLSGTSMAAPNQAGATALIRQYVRYSGIFGDSEDQYVDLTREEACEVAAIVNQLMMSTTDIVMNKNGLPYAVRKQGSGLVNINKATTAEAYLTTFGKDGSVMDKTKLELGDDKNKTGVYTMKFAINNISKSSVSYNVNSVIITEGISKTYTGHDEQTVTQDGYLLNPTTTVKAIDGGTSNGNTVTVGAKQTATVTVEVRLSDADKQYMDEYFENGMYVEGFIKLTAASGAKVDLSIPMLAFYGDWTEAPIFDEEYYDTHKDEINEGLNVEDKVMADAYATRVIGGLYSDYISTLGTYYFKQDPNATQMAANKEYIAISNQKDEDEVGNNSTLNSIRSISAGLLRNAKEVEISIVEDSTGEEIFHRTEINQHKSFNHSGSIIPSSIDVEFSSIEHNLKNNTRYTVTVTAYIDYGTKEEQNNKRNTFTFPLYIDFEAPVVTDVRYRSEYDQSTKKTKLFADIDIYDNHYAMAMQLGQITLADPDSGYTFSMETFGKYITPVHSSYNSTSTVTVELTDYIARLKDSVGMDQNSSDYNTIEYNNNSFIAVCYDYAMNVATYEIRLPDEILSAAFTEDELNLQVGKTKDLNSIMQVYPSDQWIQTLDFVSEDASVADVVNNTVVAIGAGETTIKAIKKDGKGNETVLATIPVIVTGTSGGFGGLTTDSVNKFELTGYKTNKAFYSVSPSEREIGETDSVNTFGKDGAILSMFPSESVTINYTLDSYYPELTEVRFESMNENIATVDPKTGTIVAKAEGTVYISADVYYNGNSTFYSAMITVEVKDPFNVMGMYLMSYKGNGGEVVIPDDRGITAIYQYAFSNYEYIPKDENDEISEEDPYFIKPWYIGEDTITKIVIPEGVTAIESYAFANLTALKEVVLPSTLVRIGVGAFTGCTNLTTINLQYAKFINEEAFKDCPLKDETNKGKLDLASVVSIGNYTFQGTQITSVSLPLSSQSLGVGAFADNANLSSVTFTAPKMKIGSYAFKNCPVLDHVTVNAAVISSYAFYDCTNLKDITIGKDVVVIGEYAFTGTGIAAFKVEAGGVIKQDPENAAGLLKDNELILVAPKGASLTYTTSATAIAAGAFAGNTNIDTVIAKNVKTIGDYAFAECPYLTTVDMPNVENIGNYAFAGTQLAKLPESEALSYIGNYAFAGTKLTSVTILEGATVGDYAFGGYIVTENGRRSERFVVETLTSVTIQDGVTLGKGAFYSPIYLATYENIESLYYYTPYQYYLQDKDGNYIGKDGQIVSSANEAVSYTYYSYDYKKEGSGIVPSVLTSVTIGENVTICEESFAGNAKIASLTIGDGTSIGDRAFMNAAFYDETVLSSVDLSGVISIGAYAFSGSSLYDYQEIESLAGTEDDEEPQKYVVNAYELVYVHGENGEKGDERVTAYRVTNFAPAFTEANVSGASTIGEGAFAYNEQLKKVVFGEELQSIPSYTFALCASLDDVEIPASVKEIGDYAFYRTAVNGALDLSGVDTVGKNAYAMTKISEVTFKADAKVLDEAFGNCENLSDADVSELSYIGAEAFYNTSLTFADLSNAVYVGDFAFGESNVTEVVFGEKLLGYTDPETSLYHRPFGENPFYDCEIKTFAKEVEEIFNGQVLGKTIQSSYKINDKAEIIDDVLYQKVNTGWELVSYPMAKEGAAYVVEEGTTRITARAFAGSALENVTLPTTLKALGDKALYKCEKLSVVVFKSYDAPLLEEEYDTSRISYNNLAMTGRIGEYVGLGIVKYYMWNPTSQYSNFYFGANFVDFIGDVDKHLVLVKPANGRNYSTFILDQYFSTTVEGSNAATVETVSVISLINAIPDKINLSDEEAIVAARAAYDKIATIEQKALVGNYSKLTTAESTLAYLKSRVEEPDPIDPTPQDPPKTEDPKDNNSVGFIVAIVLLSVVVVGLGGLSVYALVRGGIISFKKLATKKADGVETEETATTAEAVAEEPAEESEVAGEDETKEE